MVAHRSRSSSSRRVRRQLELQRASLEVASEQNVARLLQMIADDSRRLVGARYAATCLWSEDGHMESFTTSGMSKAQLDAVGEPVQHGLDIVLVRKELVRLSDLTQHPESTGFLEPCREMRTLLAMPMLDGNNVLGGLYLADKQPAWVFTDDDQAIISVFAQQAAAAIKNAQLSEAAVSTAVAHERQRIARELHDSLAQVLAYISHKASAAVELIGTDNETAKRHVSELGGVAREAYAEVRDTILGLRMTTDREGPFEDQLRSYLATWAEQTGVRADLQLLPPEVDIKLGSVAELQVVRIVQEALANVRRHAGATQVTVAIQRLDTGDLEVSVLDNGSGFDPPQPERQRFPRFGLTTMRERASEIGGDLHITSQRGHGTRVTLNVPRSVQSAD